MTIRRKQGAQRLKAALNRRYEPQAQTVKAGPVGANQLYAGGQIYNGVVTGVTEVVNVGRPAAALYVPKTGGGTTTTLVSGGGSASGGGGGSGLPTDGSGIMTGDLNMGGNNIVNVTLVDTVDILSLYNSYTGHNHDADYVNITGDNMTGALTINSNVVWHAGNDGTGSGLDADLWDGNEFATYLNQPVLTSSNVEFNQVTTPSITATSTLSLAPTTDIYLNPTGDDVTIFGDTRIGTDHFVSGSTGWRIDYDGTADLRAIFADSLTVETFISDVNLALAGSEIIVKSLGIVADAFVVPTVSDTLRIFDLPGLGDTQNFETGDWVRLRFVEKGTGLEVGDAWGTVSAYTDQLDGEQSWTWTRQSGTVGKSIGQGMVALDYGQSGDGYIHLTTLQSNSPYLDVATWVTDPSVPTNHTTHVRLGNLDGITSPGLNPSGWGLYADNAYLEGSLVTGGGDVSADGNGVSIKAPSTDTGWFSYSDKLTFSTDPVNVSQFNTVGQLYALRNTLSTPSRNTLSMKSRSGAAYGANSAYIEIIADAPGTDIIGFISVKSDTSNGTASVDIDAQNSDFSPGTVSIGGVAVFYNDILPFSGGTQDIGSAGKPFAKLYADQLIVNSISGNGDTQVGDIWQHDATDMYIRSSSASARTLYIANPSTGTMHLDVEGDITVGGTVDGVDILALSSSLTSHSHNDLYYTEAESDARFVGGISQGAGISLSGSIANYTVAHADTSTQGSVNNPTGYAIQDITLDTYGHITGIVSEDMDLRYLQTLGYGNGVIVTGTAPNLIIAHADSSSVANTANAGNTVVANLTFDEFGHVLTHSSLALADFLGSSGGTLTGNLVVSADTIGTAGGVELRYNDTSGDRWQIFANAHDAPSNANDLFLYRNDGVQNTILRIKSASDTVRFTNAPTVTSSDYTVWHAGNMGTGSGLDADTLDTYEATAFGRLAATQTWTANNTFTGAVTFNKGTVAAPFTLAVNTQGQLVSGLYADLLSKSVLAGDGLAGGGQMTADRTLTVDTTVARRNAANTFTEPQTIQRVAPDLIFDTTTAIWSLEPSDSVFSFKLDGVEKFAIDQLGGIDITGNLTVDVDTLYVDAVNDAVWINSGSPDGTAALKVSAPDPADYAAIFRAATGQTEYIWSIQDGTGAGLLGVDAAGNLQSLSTGFVSGISGWRISPDGSMEVNNLVARGEIRTALFVKDEISVNSGSHLFAEAARTRAAFTATTGSLSLDVHDPPYEHASVFSVGDNLLIKTAGETPSGSVDGGAAINSMSMWFLPNSVPSSGGGGPLVVGQTWLQVTAVTDMTTFYRYTVEVKGGSYLTYPENTTVVSFGQGTTGLIGVFADQNYGPYLDVFIPSTTPWNTPSALPLRLGRLDGVGLPELSAEQYGILIAKDATDVNTPRIVASNTQFSIKNVPLSMTFNNSSEPVFEVTDSNYQLGIIGQSEFGDVTIGENNQTQLVYVFSPLSESPHSFQMLGNISFLNGTDGFSNPFGRMSIGIPALLAYDPDISSGIYGGTGSIDVPDTGIRWKTNSNNTSKLDGYVAGVRKWGVGSDATWDFTDVYIGNSIQMDAGPSYGNSQGETDTITWKDVGSSPSEGWESTGATTGWIESYVDTTGAQYVTGRVTNTVRVKAFRNETVDARSSVILEASGTTNGYGELSRVTIHSSSAANYITMESDRVNMRSPVIFESGITIQPAISVDIPSEGATLYTDDSTGNIMAVWSDGTVNTVHVKV